jgi:hypothetical protein
MVAEGQTVPQAINETLKIINDKTEMGILRGHAVADLNCDAHKGMSWTEKTTASEVIQHVRKESNASEREIQNAINATAQVMRRKGVKSLLLTFHFLQDETL